jgi:hypothetical protein
MFARLLALGAHRDRTIVRRPYFNFLVVVVVCCPIILVVY